jgi:hypothetical protein
LIAIVLPEQIDVAILIVNLIRGAKAITESVQQNVTRCIKDARVAPDAIPEHLIRLSCKEGISKDDS